MLRLICTAIHIFTTTDNRKSHQLCLAWNKVIFIPYVNGSGELGTKTLRRRAGESGKSEDLMFSLLVFAIFTSCLLNDWEFFL